MRVGATPGTVDVDLNVKDQLPLYAELNNRFSPNTTPLRLITTLSQGQPLATKAQPEYAISDLAGNIDEVQSCRDLCDGLKQRHRWWFMSVHADSNVAVLGAPT
jgi:hypothetical protein